MNNCSRRVQYKLEPNLIVAFCCREPIAVTKSSHCWIMVSFDGSGSSWGMGMSFSSTRMPDEFKV